MGGLNGLGPNMRYWAVGFTATLPIMEYASVRARKESEAARVQMEDKPLPQILWV
jgi:hypothetical protein